MRRCPLWRATFQIIVQGADSCADGTRESSFIVRDGPQKKGLELELELELDERACFSVLDLSSVPFLLIELMSSCDICFPWCVESCAGENDVKQGDCTRS